MTNFYLTMIDIIFVVGFIAILLFLFALCWAILWLGIARMMRFKRIRNSLYYIWLHNEVRSISDKDYEMLQLQMYELRRDTEDERG